MVASMINRIASRTPFEKGQLLESGLLYDPSKPMLEITNPEDRFMDFFLALDKATTKIRSFFGK